MKRAGSGDSAASAGDGDCHIGPAVFAELIPAHPKRAFLTPLIGAIAFPDADGAVTPVAGDDRSGHAPDLFVVPFPGLARPAHELTSAPHGLTIECVRLSQR